MLCYSLHVFSTSSSPVSPTNAALQPPEMPSTGVVDGHWKIHKVGTEDGVSWPDDSCRSAGDSGGNGENGGGGSNGHGTKAVKKSGRI